MAVYCLTILIIIKPAPTRPRFLPHLPILPPRGLPRPIPLRLPDCPPKLSNPKSTLLKSVLESFALDMLLDGSLLLGQLDSRQPAEEEIGVILVGHQVLLVVLQVELPLHSSAIGLGLEVLLVVLESGKELVAREDAAHLAVLDELEVIIRTDQLLQLGLLSLFLGCGLCGRSLGRWLDVVVVLGHD